MRILEVGNMFPPHSLGGYEAIWRASDSYFRGRGHSTRVLTTDFRLPAAADAPELHADVHRELRWYWHEHDFPSMGARARMALERHNAAVLRRHLEELRPDVVAWWAMGGMSLSLVEQVRRAGLPAVGVVCDDWLLYGPVVDKWTRVFANRRPLGAIAERLTRLPSRVDLDAAAHWVFISDFTRRRAVERRGLSSSEVAYAGIDPDAFSPEAPRDWRWRLLYAGRLDERKGIDTVIETLGHLPDEAHLQVIGSGDEEYGGRLAAPVEEGGLTGRVELSPQRGRAELARAYAGADALVFPVRWAEPWGLVPLEAMACGTPVVATGTGGSAEYLRDGENCLLFEAGDSRALAAALSRLAEDPGLRARLREQGLETAARFPEEAFNAAVADAIERAR
jgi:glycosyltransferase involved in cell wall biosynthesis